MRALNVLEIILVLIIAVIFAEPALTCNVDTCRADCIANNNGATDGICQVERNGELKCMCSYNPIPPPCACDTVTCRNDCIANNDGATGGICQVERNGERKCICSYN